jgi:hypothetical protein
MNLWKFSVFLGLCVVALLAGLMILKGPEMFTLERIAGPRLPVADYMAGEGSPKGVAGPQSDEILPEAVPEKPKPAKLPEYGNGPGIPPPPSKVFADGVSTDPAKRAAYRSAVDALTVIGCAGKKVALKIAGANAPQTVSSGATLHFAGGMELVVRIADSSRCRVVLSDHGHPVGEAASF